MRERQIDRGNGKKEKKRETAESKQPSLVTSLSLSLSLGVFKCVGVWVCYITGSVYHCWPFPAFRSSDFSLSLSLFLSLFLSLILLLLLLLLLFLNWFVWIFVSLVRTDDLKSNRFSRDRTDISMNETRNWMKCSFWNTKFYQLGSVFIDWSPDGQMN